MFLFLFSGGTFIDVSDYYAIDLLYFATKEHVSYSSFLIESCQRYMVMRVSGFGPNQLSPDALGSFNGSINDENYI